MKANETVLSIADMLRAFMERDASYDGLFFAAVTTTGIYCRPSCSARKPKPENVRFFADATDAVRAGFRACLRCKPDETVAAVPDWVTELASRAESGERLTDSELAGEGVNPVVARHAFRKAYGMTFQAYCRSARVAHAFSGLKQGKRIDDAVFDSGWESHSGFRDAFTKAAGSPPGAAARRDYIRLTWIQTPLGQMVAGATEDSICLLEFNEPVRVAAQLGSLSRKLGIAPLAAESELFVPLRAQLSEYFAGERRQFDLPISYHGTDFQQKVWDALLRIPYGETCSYAELARDIGAAHAHRAVGNANGRNRIAILVPCHRVIGNDGSICGYGGGVWRKLRLLETEAPQRSKLKPLTGRVV